MMRTARSDRDYGILGELKARKMLEANTGPTVEFRKNPDTYGYDLQVIKWSDDPEAPDDHEVLAYIDVEVAKKWRTGEPPRYWSHLNFLNRKLFETESDIVSRDRINHGIVEWSGPKRNADKAFYLKFNREMDNCFYATIDDVIEYGEPGYQNNGQFEHDVHTLPMDADASLVGWGIDSLAVNLQAYIGAL